jgi:hypothetical protein
MSGLHSDIDGLLIWSALNNKLCLPSTTSQPQLLGSNRTSPEAVALGGLAVPVQTQATGEIVEPRG